MPKVLIADDSLKVQKELAELLKQSGAEVVTVSNGEHAVRKLPTEKPDLILADIFMPVRSGYEVCEFVKNSDEFSHVPVLLLASKMEPFDEAEAQRVRADGKVEKPIGDAEAVLAVIQQHLQKAEAEKPAPPIEEFAAAVPTAEAEAEPAAEPEPEPEQFSTRPPPVKFDQQEAPMGFADVEEGAEKPAAAPPSEEPVDISKATMLTSADELRRRKEKETGELPGVGGFQEPPAEEPAPPIAGFEPPPPAPEAEKTKIEKPEVPAPWEMTGPEPGAPEIPAAGGWDSQWKGGEEEGAAPTEAPPAQEEPAAEAPPAAGAEKPYAPEEFAAAFGGGAEAPPQEPSAEAAPAEPTPVEAPPAEEPATAAARVEPHVDPAVVDEVVNQVLERLSPQVMATITREIVRPLAETLLKEKLQK